MMGLRLDSHVLIGALMLRADQLRLLVPSLLDHLNVLRISLLAPSLGQSLSFRMHISKFMEQMFAAHPILVVELKHLGQKLCWKSESLLGRGIPLV
jgi:hypothetical protein